MIYMDNAATTQPDIMVRTTVLSCMESIWANPSTLYDFGRESFQIIQEARKTIAECIGAFPDEIYFTSGGSESNNQAIITTALQQRKSNPHLISTIIEHHSVLRTLEELKNYGFEVTLVPVKENGIVDPKDIANAIRPNTTLVTVMYANNEIGTIQPITEIGAICKEKGILFHTDAVQAVGHLPINVREQNIDMMSFSGHKFHGPKGIGALYVKNGVPISSLIKGGNQERGKRAGTENIAGIAGMATAISMAYESLEDRNKYILSLRDHLIKGLSQIPDSLLNGDRNNRLPGNVSFCFKRIEGTSLVLLLNDKNICASSGSACDSDSLKPSHVLTSIGIPEHIAIGSLRLTLDHNNTKQQVDTVIKAVKESVEYLRSFSQEF